LSSTISIGCEDFMLNAPFLVVCGFRVLE